MKKAFQRLVAMALAVVMLGGDAVAAAETLATLMLPASLKVIEEEAFMGTSVDQIVIPQGAEEIGERAFADGSIGEIIVPESVKHIADNAFENTTLQAFTAEEDTYAYAWGVSNGFIKEDEDLLVPVITSCVLENGTGIHLEWQGHEEASHHYRLDYSTKEFGDETHSYTFVYDTQYTIYGLKPNTTYYLRLTGIDDEYSHLHTTKTFTITTSTAVQNIPVTGLNYAGETDYVYFGFTNIGEDDVYARNDVEVEPYNASNQQLKWISSDPTIASVEEDTGIITGRSYGTVELTVTATDGSDVSLNGYYRVLPRYPEGFEAVVDGTSIHVSWDAAPEADCYDLACYDVETSEIVEELLDYKELNYLFTGLKPNHEYQITLQSGVYMDDGSVFYGVTDWYDPVATGEKSEPVPEEVFTVVQTTDNYAKITGYSGREAELVIPEQIGEWIIAEIGDSAFENAGFLTSVSLPDTVTTIGENAFSGCSELVNAKLPGNLVTIKAGAFSGTKLNTMVVPEGTKEIQSKAFADCSLVEIDLPASLETMAADTFDGSYPVLVVYEDSYAQKWTEENGYVKWIWYGETYEGDYAYKLLDDGTVEISYYWGRDEEITIPSEIAGAAVSSIGYCAFYDQPIKSVIILEGIKNIGEAAFLYCEELESVLLPNTLEYIGQFAFQFCSSLTSVVVPESVNIIDAYAFSKCFALESITLPQTMSFIGENAFWDDSVLNNVTLPSGLTSIEESLFGDCVSLSSITVPAGVVNLGPGAFIRCTSLESVELPESLETISERAFEDCTRLATLVIPEKVSSIANDAFGGCNDPLFYVHEGSYAEEWCKTNQYSYQIVNKGEDIAPLESHFSVAEINVTANRMFDVQWVSARDAQWHKLYILNENGENILQDGVLQFRPSSKQSKTLYIRKPGIYYARLYTSVEDKHIFANDWLEYPYCEMRIVVSEAKYDFELEAAKLDADTILFSASCDAESIQLYQSGQVSSANVTLLNILSSSPQMTEGENKVYKSEYSTIYNQSYIFWAVTNDGKTSNPILIAGSEIVNIMPEVSNVVMSTETLAKGDTISFTSGTVIGNDLRIYGIEAFYVNEQTGERHLPAVWDTGYVWKDNIDLSPFELNSFEAYTLLADNEIAKYRIWVSAMCYGNIQVDLPTSAYIYVTEKIIDDTTIPTVSNYRINNKATELTVKEGDTLMLSGTVLGGNANLNNLQVSILRADNQGLGVAFDRAENINAASYDLSAFDPIVVGQEYEDANQKLTMQAGYSYLIMLHASDVNGVGFGDLDPTVEGPQGPAIKVNVIASAEKPEIDMSSAKLDKYTYYPGDTIVISGISVKNADFVHFSGNNGYVTAFDVEVSNHTNYHTMNDVELTLPTWAVEGTFYISVTACDDDGNESDVDKSLEYKVSLDADVPEETVPELDMSNAKLDKDTYKPGDTIVISGISVKNTDYVHFSGNNGYVTAFDVEVTNHTSYHTMNDVELVLPRWADEGTFYISVTACDDAGNESDIDKSLEYTVARDVGVSGENMPELDMSSATLDKYTYYPGDTIVVSGIKVKNADEVYLYGSNGWLSDELHYTWAINYSTEMETIENIYLKIPENAANGDYYLAVGSINRAIDEYALSEWEDRLKYIIRGGVTVLPELDISEVKLDKTVYAPGETIYVTGIQYKNTNFIRCKTQFSGMGRLTDKVDCFQKDYRGFELSIPEWKENGVYELTVAAYDYQHTEEPNTECENWPQSETYTFYLTVDDGTASTANPTVSNYKINNIATELTVKEGDLLTLSGTVYGGNTNLNNLQVSILRADNQGLGVAFDRAENINAASYDLSAFDPIVVGQEYEDANQKITMQAGYSYLIMLHASDVNGVGFGDLDPTVEGPQGPAIKVNVVAADVQPDSAEIKTLQVKQSDTLSSQLTVTGLLIMPDGYVIDDFKYVGIQYALAESYDAATDTGWKETLFAHVSADGSIDLTIKQLKPETEYVFRAVAYDNQQQKWLCGNAISHQTPAHTAYDDLISDESGPVAGNDGVLPDTAQTLDPVEITYPVNGDMLNTTDVVLKWKPVDNAERYYIYVRDITAGEEESKEDKYLLTPVGGVEKAFIDSAEDYAVSLIYDLADNKQFEYGHTYNIAIKAESALYESSWGVTKIVIDRPYLSAPQMITPASKDNNQYTNVNDVLFQWTSVEHATQYKVYIKDVTALSEEDIWSDKASGEVVLDGYVYSNPSVVDGVVSLNVGSLAEFKVGHTYKACVMASDGGIAYKDTMAPAFIFFIGNETNILSAFDIQMTHENSSLTAYMNSSVTAKWTAPANKNIVGYTLEGYLIELSTTENGVEQYASATVGADATEFKMRLNEWSRVDGGTGVEETKKGDQPYLWSVTPIIKTPDGRTVYGYMSAFNLTVYAAKEVEAPSGLDVTGTWLPTEIWDMDTWWWVIDPNTDDDITASWDAYEGNGHKLRLTWYKDGTDEYADRLGDYSISKAAASYVLEKEKLTGEGTYVAKLYAVYSEFLYDGCVYTYVESEPATKKFKVGATEGTPDGSEGNTDDSSKYAAVVAPVVGTEDDEGNKVDTWRWSENGSWASYQGSKGIEARDWHVGIDIGDADNEINPIADGTVIQSDWNNANGNTITIEHKILIDGNERTIYSFYAHMKNASKFEAGDEVTTSDVIGVVGSTGSSSLGDHLHLAIVTGAEPQADTVGYVYLKDFYSDFDGKTGSDFESLMQTYVNAGKILKGPSSSDYDVVGIDSVTYGNKTFHNPWKFIGSNSNYKFVVTPPEDDNNNSEENPVTSDHDLLGAISRKYETTAGPGAISSGNGDAGGKSYGSYQFASTKGAPYTFAKWLTDNSHNNSEWVNIGNRLINAYNSDGGYGTNFDTTWKDLANVYGDSFYNAQTEYVYEKFYVRYIDKINGYSQYGVSGLAEYGTEQNIYSLAIHQMIWARAVQGAPDPQWIAEAWDIADKKDGSDDGKVDPKLWIYQVYWEASKTAAEDPKDRDSDKTAYIIQPSDCVVEGYDYTDMLSGTYLVYFYGSTSPWQVGVYRRLNPVNGKEYLDVMSQYNADK